MANSIQRLPVIEWQPERSPIARTYAAPAISTDSKDFGFIVSMIAVGAVLVSGLVIAGITSVNTQPTPQNYTHRSY